MNAISGPSQAAAVAALLTNAPVRSVRRIPTQDERVAAPQADRYVPSGSFSPTPQVTYGRSGQGGGSWGGGAPSAQQQSQALSGADADHDGDSA